LKIREENRGKHTPKHAATGEQVHIIQKHILSFPSEQSHYSLNKKEAILNHESDVKKMWNLYKEQEENKGQRVLGYNRYLAEFNKYGLRFAPYKTDT
jgi:hypothetical protein